MFKKGKIPKPSENNKSEWDGKNVEKWTEACPMNPH